MPRAVSKLNVLESFNNWAELEVLRHTDTEHADYPNHDDNSNKDNENFISTQEKTKLNKLMSNAKFNKKNQFI